MAAAVAEAYTVGEEVADAVTEDFELDEASEEPLPEGVPVPQAVPDEEAVAHADTESVPVWETVPLAGSECARD